MKPKIKYILFLAWIFSVYLLGLLVFTKGFLLKRFVLDEVSSCSDEFPTFLSEKVALSNEQRKTNSHNDCWYRKKFDKAIVIIIDALRYDFAKFDTRLSKEEELPYQNKLTIFHEILESRPFHSRLYKFRADPPTTTLQRLKGLTTGSLPTFVDAGSNFASAEILEDNWVDQMVNGGLKFTFLGDDTWMSLYPNRFSTTYDYPSFNVKDLHTVDNGIMKHLGVELQKADWDVTIAHFLGVDHCGHRYGPKHPEMAKKLLQMDGMIRKVIEGMSNDTVLFVLGDHGMTSSGDHGGDSENELDAAMFVYSQSKLTLTLPKKNVLKSVSQTDLVPTISLLLGVPIPFASLGSVIPEMFTTSGRSSSRVETLLSVVKALRVNALQVRRYIQAYSKQHRDLPSTEAAELNLQVHKSEAELQDIITLVEIAANETATFNRLRLLKKSYIDYLQQTRSMCSQVWAQFDIGCMILGLLIVATALSVSILLLFSSGSSKHLRLATIASLWNVIYFLFLYYVGLSTRSLIISVIVGLIIIGFSIFVVFKVLEKSSLVADTKLIAHVPGDWSNLVAGLLSALLFASSFSNSFVVFEDSTLSFLFITLLFIVLVKNHCRWGVAQLTFAICAIVRATIWLRRCREEQWPCESSSFNDPISILSSSDGSCKNERYFFSTFCLFVLCFCFRRWLQFCGNLNAATAATVVCAKYLIPLAGLFTALYWALTAAPVAMLESLSHWQVAALPLLVYAVVALVVVCVALAPLMVYVVPQQGAPPPPESSAAPTIYDHLKLNWRSYFLNEEAANAAPVVCGLATVYSAPFVVLAAALSVLLCLLLGDGLAVSVLVLDASLVLLLELSASCLHPGREAVSVSWATICCWNFLMWRFFYATGHQATITAIRWEAAFHGFQGDFDFFAIPAVLITLNTFASQALCTLALPLLCCWPLVRGTQKAKHGEVVLNEDKNKSDFAFFQLFLSHLTFSGLKMSASLLAAFVHRRHLMVWKVFAPHFIYDAASFLFVGIFIFIINCFLLRVDVKLDKWWLRIQSSS